MNNAFFERNPTQDLNENQLIVREEAKELAKQMNNVYNRIVFSCQKRCLTIGSNEDGNKISEAE